MYKYKIIRKFEEPLTIITKYHCEVSPARDAISGDLILRLEDNIFRWSDVSSVEGGKVTELEEGVRGIIIVQRGTNNNTVKSNGCEESIKNWIGIAVEIISVNDAKETIECYPLGNTDETIIVPMDNFSKVPGVEDVYNEQLLENKETSQDYVKTLEINNNLEIENRGLRETLDDLTGQAEQRDNKIQDLEKKLALLPSQEQI